MVRLRTLGGLTIESDRGPVSGAAAQRKRLAMLTLLASAAPRGMSREKVASILWPESDQDRARNVIAQALFAVRRDLGQDAVIGSAGSELRLGTNVITCDRCDFESALDQGELERAANLYSGPFLDGFHLPDAPEFERWADGERRYLARRYADALESLASSCSARGDSHGAATWWRRLAAVDPTNSRVALGLMHALTAAGDRAGAIQYARLHEILLREELGIGPDDTVVALAERLRRPASTSSSSSLETTRGNFVAASGAPQLPIAQTTVESPLAARATTATPNDVVRQQSASSIRELRTRLGVHRRTRPFLTAGIVVGALVALIVAIVLRAPAARAFDPSGTVTVAILPFTVHGSDGGYLGDGMVDLISRNLSDAGVIRPVDPRALLGYVSGRRRTDMDADRAGTIARHFGAGRYVLGNITETGGRLRVTASVYVTGNPTGPVAETHVEGEQRQLFEMVDRLTADLVAAMHDRPTGRLVRTAALTTTSYPALKAYLQGEAHYREGKWADAIAAYQQAITADTGFVVAYYRLSMAADWGSRAELVHDAAEHAYRASGRLSWRDSVFVDGYFAWRQSDVGKAEHLYRELLRHYPDDVETWYQLGEVLFHRNPSRGRSFLESRDAFEHVLRFAPENVDAISHLVRIAAREREPNAIDSLARRASQLRPGVEALEMRALRASIRGDSTAIAGVVDELQDTDDLTRYNTVWRLATYARDFALAARISDALVEPSRPAGTRTGGHELRSQMLLAQGRWRDARREFEATAKGDQSHGLVRRGVWSALPFLALPPRELLAVRDSIALTRPIDPAERSPDSERPEAIVRRYVIGLLSARAGDTVSALTEAARLASFRVVRDNTSHPGALARTYSASLRAHVHWIAGRTREALAELQPVREGRATTHDFLEGYDRYVVAELLRENGLLQEAAGWYGSLGDFTFMELPYIAPSHLRQSTIYEALGDQMRAREHRKRFADLWRTADPELRGVAEAIGQGRRLVPDARYSQSGSR